VKCGHRFEKIEGFDASTRKKCPKCGATAERQVSASAIQFKGSGWYVTDYAGKKSGSGESGTGEAPKNSEKSGDSKDKSADSKDKSTESKDKPAASSEKSSDKPGDKSEKTSKKKK
jgi:putative FmdB family regulatory protein